jgi:hypothetical protein
VDGRENCVFSNQSSHRLSSLHGLQDKSVQGYDDGLQSILAEESNRTGQGEAMNEARLGGVHERLEVQLRWRGSLGTSDIHSGSPARSLAFHRIGPFSMVRGPP